MSERNTDRKICKIDLNAFGVWIPFYKEFDPGSGRTLAARLTHASRTGCVRMKFSDGIWMYLVANG